MISPAFNVAFSGHRLLVGLMMLLLMSSAIIQPVIVPQDDSFAIPAQNQNDQDVGTAPNTLLSPTPEEAFLPSQVDVEVQVTHTEEAYDGYNLFVLTEQVNILAANHYAVIMDMDGNIIHEKYIGSGIFAADVPAQMIGPKTVLVGTASGAAIWNLEDDSLRTLSGIAGHHEYEYNERDNTFFVLEYQVVNIDGIDYLYDNIVEYTEAGVEIWSLDTSTFIDPSQWCPYHDFFQGYPDISHGNTIFFDQEDDIIYFNSRNTNTFYKIDHVTGDVLWALGEHGDFDLYDYHGAPREDLFFHAHAVERVDDNTFILFDNDYHNQTDFWSQSSRIVEIEVNEVEMTARVSWVYSAPITYYSSLWGDADRLPNGNRLGVFGTYSHPETTTGAMLVEVDESGNIVWEMDFPPAIGVSYGVYRVERIQLTPSLSSPEDRLVLPNTEVNLNWQAWYNFRPKRAVQASYSLLLNGSEIESGIFEYDQYWRSAELVFGLGILPRGGNNVTLVVEDGDGNCALDTVLIWVGPFGLWRQGPTCFEIGEPDTTIQWVGLTASPLQCVITVDGSIVQDFEWNGADINLDLFSFEAGTHSITMELTNGSIVVQTESFEFDIYPPTLPKLVSPGSQMMKRWNDQLVLTWELFDIRPSNWIIYLNGTVRLSGKWSSQSQTIEWTTPLLEVGIYGITFVAQDRAGHCAASKIELEVLVPSPPVITYAGPIDQAVEWGEENVVLKWEVRGGTKWTLWRDETEFLSGEVTSISVEIEIEDWLAEAWFLDRYNLTLQVSTNSASTSSTIWLTVILNPGDSYADAYLAERSFHYIAGENALGAPDNQSATLFLEYGNGEITLDMGEHEEIVDGVGDDFTVHAVGNYTVFAIDDISQMMRFIAYGKDTQRFDLNDVGLDSARYVKVEFRIGESVLLDAIEALNCIVTEGDDNPPVIEGPDDQSSHQGEVINLIWHAYDVTPFLMRVYANDTLVGFYEWTTSEVFYDFITYDVGMWNITAEFWDLYGNNASDSVNIEIIEGPAPFPWESALFFTASAAGVLVLVGIVVKRKRNAD
ncbi:MAG: aryl-sulfate sulfotransferase [Candidatus Thorarchaeota archaeon]